MIVSKSAMVLAVNFLRMNMLPAGNVNDTQTMSALMPLLDAASRGYTERGLPNQASRVDKNLMSMADTIDEVVL